LDSAGRAGGLGQPDRKTVSRHHAVQLNLHAGVNRGVQISVLAVCQALKRLWPPWGGRYLVDMYGRFGCGGRI
jgi:hypothetical protein